MRKLIEKKFFDRNTSMGVERFLSAQGFDLELGYTLKPGPTKRFVYAVQNEPPPVEPPEKVVKKVEPKPDVKKRMKAAMKKIKASRS